MNDLHRSWVHFYIIFQISKYLRNEELMAHILAPAHRSIIALSVLLHLILEKKLFKEFTKQSFFSRKKQVYVYSNSVLVKKQLFP